MSIFLNCMHLESSNREIKETPVKSSVRGENQENQWCRTRLKLEPKQQNELPEKLTQKTIPLNVRPAQNI